MPDTVLSLSGLGVPPYSARGCRQSLDAIDGAGDFDRDVNGGVVDLSPPQFKKFRSTITCEDTDAPAFDGVPLGKIVTVDCVHELPFLTSTGEAERTVVSGSERVVGDWTYYCPQLIMMITGFSSEQDEYGHTVSWQLELVEV